MAFACVRLQAGGFYGTKQMSGPTDEPTWHLISGATLAEACYLAHERAGSSAQVMGTFSKPLKVVRLAPSLGCVVGTPPLQILVRTCSVRNLGNSAPAGFRLQALQC